MTTYYKILVNGKSCHGGDYEWSLPDGDKPGEWTPHIEIVDKCKVGYHLTTKPYKWYAWGCDCYEAEARGIEDSSVDDKVVCQQARLLRKVDHPQWWKNAIEFVNSISDVKFFCNQDADPSWEIHDNWAAARAAARAAAWAAARAAARAAAWDAAWNATKDADLLVSVIISEIDKSYSMKRWDVWKRGYGLLAEVNGVFYVYRRP